MCQGDILMKQQIILTRAKGNLPFGQNDLFLLVYMILFVIGVNYPFYHCGIGTVDKPTFDLFLIIKLVCFSVF